MRTTSKLRARPDMNRRPTRCWSPWLLLIVVLFLTPTTTTTTTTNHIAHAQTVDPSEEVASTASVSASSSAAAASSHDAPEGECVVPADMAHNDSSSLEGLDNQVEETRMDQPVVVNGNDNEEDEDNDNDEEEEEEEQNTKEYELQLNVFGKPQKIEIMDDGLPHPETLAVYDTSVKYMKNKIIIMLPVVVQNNNNNNNTVKYKCRNFDAMCTIWAMEGYCNDDLEHNWMVEHCSPACGTCDLLESYFYSDKDDDDEDDDDEEEEEDHDHRLLEIQMDFELDLHEASDEDEQPEPIELLQAVEPILWGIPQNMGVAMNDDDNDQGQDETTSVRQVLTSMDQYMLDDVYNVDSDLAVLCENKHRDCSIWASMGLCEENSEYMHFNCAPACHTCQELYFEARCPMDPEAPVAFKEPGDLNAMFERIVSDPHWNEHHGPLSVVSSPATTEGPWMLTFDSFLTDEECDRLIEMGKEREFHVSTQLGDMEIDGTQEGVLSEHRTSTNSWCQDDCYKDPVTQTVQDRIEKLIGIPESYWEYLQLLRYEPGQYYNEHHDYHYSQVLRPPGPRILTVFLYLNDVQAGGGTFFDQVNITVQPKKGRMAIWPSVLDEDPEEWDPRTSHAALPVEAGMKYGANAWVHLRDWKGANNRGCS